MLVQLIRSLMHMLEYTSHSCLSMSALLGFSKNMQYHKLNLKRLALCNMNKGGTLHSGSLSPVHLLAVRDPQDKKDWLLSAECEMSIV